MLANADDLHDLDDVWLTGPGDGHLAAALSAKNLPFARHCSSELSLRPLTGERNVFQPNRWVAQDIDVGIPNAEFVPDDEDLDAEHVAQKFVAGFLRKNRRQVRADGHFE